MVENDIDITRLEQLKAAGIVGVAFNLPFHGTGYYRNATDLLEKLIELGLFLQIQFEQDQLLALLPLIERSQRASGDRSLRPAHRRERTGSSRHSRPF